MTVSHSQSRHAHIYCMMHATHFNIVHGKILLRIHHDFVCVPRHLSRMALQFCVLYGNFRKVHTGRACWLMSEEGERGRRLGGLLLCRSCTLLTHMLMIMERKRLQSHLLPPDLPYGAYGDTCRKEREHAPSCSESCEIVTCLIIVLFPSHQTFGDDSVPCGGCVQIPQSNAPAQSHVCQHQHIEQILLWIL